MIHQESCLVCIDLRSRAPASDPEDCPDLVRLQNNEAVRLMGGGPVRPSPSLVDESVPVAERMRARLAQLNAVEVERPRAGPPEKE